MKKFVHTFQVVNVAMIERVTEVDEDVYSHSTVIRLTVKQNWASPSTTIFTNSFVIDVTPEDVGIEEASLYGNNDGVIALQKLVGRSFQGYYENGQITVVESFNLASQRGEEIVRYYFDTATM